MRVWADYKNNYWKLRTTWKNIKYSIPQTTIKQSLQKDKKCWEPSTFVFYCCSIIQSCPMLCNPMDCSTSDLPVPQYLPDLAQIHVHWAGWCHPTILSSVVRFSSRLQSFPASGPFPVSQFFTSGGSKYWSFSFSIIPLNEHSGLISFTIDWFDLPAVQGTLKSLLQHHSSKASVLQHSAFFVVQLSHLYVTAGKTIALTGQTFVGSSFWTCANRSCFSSEL